MLLKLKTLEKIVSGDVTVVFRRWLRPTVKNGTKMYSSKGLLLIKKITKISLAQISEKDAKLAGHESRETLLKELRARSSGDYFRIDLSYRGADSRVELGRKTAFTKKEKENLLGKIAALEKRSGAWVKIYLQCIRKNPGVRAQDIAAEFGEEALRLKAKVRKLKNLGLTISLDTGYEISPRGKEVLKWL